MKNLRMFFKSLWYLGKGYWQSEQNRKAVLLFLGIVALTLGNVYLAVLLNAWKNAFYSALQNYNKVEIIRQLVIFLKLAAIYMVISIYVYYLQQTLALNWRKWFTEKISGDWLKNKNYYHLQIFGANADNPDQRISEDIKLFVDFSLKFTVGLLNAACTFFSFIFILWTLSGVLEFNLFGYDVRINGYVVWIAILYSIIGTYISHIVGKKLTLLNFNQQRYEADFRFSMMRLRENAESIAFYNGEEREMNILAKRFRLLFENFKKIINKEKQLIGIKSAYFQLANVFPVIVAVPLYLGKKINLGGLMQTASAFGKVQGALSYFVLLYSDFAQLRAVVERLDGFLRHMRENEKAKLITKSEAKQYISVKNLQINLPNKEILLKNLNFSISRGRNTLIKGVNGCGKSTLIRAISGLWPYTMGLLELPEREKMMFIAQRPYLPLGTLKDSLLYPSCKGISDGSLIELMRKCEINHFAKDLALEADWYQVLSVGEQQKLAFLRALILQPEWLFLDEATSAMDENAQELMYYLLREHLPKTTIISIGHRITLDKYHHQQLIFQKDMQTFVLRELV